MQQARACPRPVRVLGDVGQPDLVGQRCGEVPLDQVVVDGRPGDLARRPAALLRGRRPDPVLPAESLDRRSPTPGPARSSSSEMNR